MLANSWHLRVAAFLLALLLQPNHTAAVMVGRPSVRQCHNGKAGARGLEAHHLANSCGHNHGGALAVVLTLQWVRVRLSLV